MAEWHENQTKLSDGEIMAVHFDLLEQIASTYSYKMPFDFYEVNDYISIVIPALIRAVRTYNPDKTKSFKNYSYFLAFQELIEELYKNYTSERRKLLNSFFKDPEFIKSLIEEMENTLKRNLTDEEEKKIINHLKRPAHYRVENSLKAVMDSILNANFSDDVLHALYEQVTVYLYSNLTTHTKSNSSSLNKVEDNQADKIDSEIRVAFLYSCMHHDANLSEEERTACLIYLETEKYQAVADTMKIPYHQARELTQDGLLKLHNCINFKMKGKKHG